MYSALINLGFIFTLTAQFSLAAFFVRQVSNWPVVLPYVTQPILAQSVEREAGNPLIKFLHLEYWLSFPCRHTARENGEGRDHCNTLLLLFQESGLFQASGLTSVGVEQKQESLKLELLTPDTDSWFLRSINVPYWSDNSTITEKARPWFVPVRALVPWFNKNKVLKIVPFLRVLHLSVYM